MRANSGLCLRKGPPAVPQLTPVVRGRSVRTPVLHKRRRAGRRGALGHVVFVEASFVLGDPASRSRH